LYCSVKSICWSKGIPGVLWIVSIRLVAAHLNHAIAQSSQRYQSDAADNLELPTDKDEGEDATTIYWVCDGLGEGVDDIQPCNSEEVTGVSGD
jgi:hypothetical protein